MLFFLVLFVLLIVPLCQEDKMELVYVLQEDPRNYDIRHDSSE